MSITTDSHKDSLGAIDDTGDQFYETLIGKKVYLHLTHLKLNYINNWCLTLFNVCIYNPHTSYISCKMLQ